MINAIVMLLALFAPIMQPQAPAVQPPAQAPGSSPAISGIAPLGFQLGPGDGLDCTAWNGNDSQRETLVVAADGTILIPFSVNKLVNVTGLTSLQVRDLIEEAMRRNFRQPTVQCVQNRIESRKATLVGEVPHPGAYPITGDTSLLDLLLGSGGFNSAANIAEVQVSRRLKTPEYPDGRQLKVNVLSALLGYDFHADVKLEPGDIVFVPSVQSVGTKIFIIIEGRGITLLQRPEKINLLEALSGAATGVGVSLARVVVMRYSPVGGPTLVQDVRFADLYKKADLSMNIPLETGDIVFIPKNTLARINDVMNAINPFLSFISNTALYSSIFSKSN